MKKKFVKALIIGIIALVVLEITVYFINKPKYMLQLPSAGNLESIQVGNKKMVTNEEIVEFLNLLNKEGRTTKEASIQDSPVKESEELKIDFHFIDSGTSTIFVYKRNNHYYIEQPYNGIYKITESEYEMIKSYGLEKY